MACTALMDQQVQPLYFSVLDQPTPPGVRNLQQWVEDAWKAGEHNIVDPLLFSLLTDHKGFDPEGAAELKGKLVGTKKWIGTAGKL